METPISSKIGILLTDAANQDQVAIIEFHPGGVLVFHSLRNDMHVFALKPIEGLLKKTVLRKPLFAKYARVLREQSSLPVELLEREARKCASALNKLKRKPKAGDHTVVAKMVHY